MLSKAIGMIPESDVDKVETWLFCFTKLREVVQAVEANLGRFGLSLARMGILAMLHDCGKGMTPSELAEQGGIARATVTGLINGLEKDGLVTRIQHPEDRRMHVIQLTARGHELITAALPSHFRQIASLFDSLTPSEREQLTHLMARIGVGSRPST